MKRLLLILISAYSLSMYAIDREFPENHYKIMQSSVNTKTPIAAISSFNDNLFLIRDGRVYVGKVGNNASDISKCTEKADLSALNIDGTFCQFGNNILYYSSDGVLYQASLKNGEWKSPEVLQISGYAKERVMGEGSSLAHRRWGFKTGSKSKEKMYNPSIAEKGHRLYFSSSELPGGKGGLDIWYIERNSDKGPWTAPINYEEVNTPDDEDFPQTVGDTMFYFSSNRHDDKFRGFNIYKRKLKGKKTISIVENNFNGNADDKNFLVVTNTPFFISNREGSAQIYRPEFYDPDLVLGNSAGGDPENIKIQRITIKDKTCTFRPEFDGKRFAAHYSDEFELIYQFVNDPPNCRIEVIGYADDEGSADHNSSLSLNRASAVMDKLIQMGVDEQRITYRGEGNGNPIIKNAKTEQEHNLNRRIEIIKK